MNLYPRDYLLGLTEDEKREYDSIRSKELEGRTFGRKNLYYQYPLAARNYNSLFPNNHLDFVDFKKDPAIVSKNDGFAQLLSNRSISERDILNYINKTPAFHIVGSILRGCRFPFGHHGTYLFPEFQLGTSYQADYLLIGNGSGGYQFVFIEFENPFNSITLNDGNLGSTFRKGINQVQDWRRWLQENYFVLYENFEKSKLTEQQLPREFIKYDAFRIHYVVVAGMRDDFNEKTYQIRREYMDQQKIHLLHYNNLLDFSYELVNYPTY